MTNRRLKWILFLAVVAVVLGYYALASAPSAAFWDCSEFIATGYSLGIPHPPSTPLFVMLARLVSFIPLRHEIAGRITLISSMFGSVCCGMIYLLVVYLIGLQHAPLKKKTDLKPGSRPAPKPADRIVVAPVPEADAGLKTVAGADVGAAARERIDWVPHLAGVVGALCCAFAYSFMWNTVEAIIFTPAATVAMAVTLLAVLWYIKEGRHVGDNRIVMACFYILVLSTGIHFTPMITFFALIPFFLIVDRRSVVDLRLIELFGFFIIILTMSVVPGIAAKILWGAALTVLFYFGMKILEGATRDRQVAYASLLFVAMFVMAYVAGMSTEAHTEGARNLVMDNIVLFLASPIAGLMDRMFANLPLFLLLVLGYAGYLYYLHTQKKLNTAYAMVGLFLFLLAGTVQFYLLVRAHQVPHINEVDPAHWKSFAASLRREQYNAMRLFPRQTQYLLESDYQNYRNAEPNYGLIAGYFEQVKYYVRYFLWQWAGRFNLDLYVTSKTVFLQPLKFFPALIGLIPPFLGVWGMIDHWKRERKTAVLVGVAFLVASWGLFTYLNNKFSPSDPRAASVQETYRQPMYVEVRERDYFYAFSFIFFTIFVGLGLNAFFRWLRVEARSWFARKEGGGAKATVYAAGVVALLVPFLVLSFNYPENNRRFNWIPTEYGYNVLASCENGSVIFTNGDNDTFPLWFVQEVPSDVTKTAAAQERAMPGYPKELHPKTMESIQYGYKTQVGPKWGVGVANLSLLNTDWYCKQLKAWGAPVSLTNEQIEQLASGGLVNREQTRHFILSQIMIRDIVATNTGIRLRWPDEYTMSTEDFRRKVFANYQPQMSVYFATTVSPENTKDVDGHLRQKGLAQLIVPEEVPTGQEFDGPATIDIVFNKLKFTSSLDPRVVKDDNTRGLLINYARTFLDVAQYCDRVHDTTHGVQASLWALQLGLDKEKRAQLMFLMSRLLANFGKPELAQRYVDSANTIIKQDPTTRVQTAWTQAAILKAQGNFAASESIYQNIVRMAPELYWDLIELYRGTGEVAKAKTTLETWYRSVPQNWDNTLRLVDAMVQQLADRRGALAALDSYAFKNPKDSQKVRLTKENL
jgi:hypothetical protein